ncbi:uncharacterized protein HMPREF1541_06085 [Cyphellophora europaea CBS 101466]|uniref:Methyltransferase small domain-containing protein n=1 Tax=Cyphellophora europaea (strain CBS 101466) TaxID=1220924 RepID=W2RVZ9_CYPE1|nr:uncharacterized protein HMPREF1541_06085 [Cyphellophora europaea CBS 101466]ETN39859.1 hypothetical protein HMPREF1541_06085 [Cyphellophora europaea CBS 101466]
MTKLPTPSTSHLSALLNTTIYEPAEDSYLFLDTLSSPTERAFLRSHFPHPSPTPLVTELGTGSGVIIAFLTAHARDIFGRPILSLGVDVNLDACSGTQQTVAEAVRAASATDATTATTAPPTGTYLASTCADLTSALRPGEIDVLVFNPPYVPSETLPALPWSPTPTSVQTAGGTTTIGDTLSRAQLAHAKFERESHLLSLTYAGGADGMETTNRLLKALPGVLSERGVAYVLFCAQNRPGEVVWRIRDWRGGSSEDEDGDGGVQGRWMAEVVGETGGKGGWERLCVVRIWRQASGGRGGKGGG